MKYLSITIIKAALDRVHNGVNTQEHITSSVTSSLIAHYFPKEKYISTPEQIQEITRKRPDFTIEKLDENNIFHKYAFAEVKSLINSNFDNILDQLSDSIIHAVDNIEGNYTVYAIAMKGTKIAIFIYRNYVTLLDDYDIYNYKGFTPLNYQIPFKSYADINKNLSLGKFCLNMLTGIETNPDKLRAMGVESSPKMSHPYIWDLLNKNHEEHIHNMFIRMATINPGEDID